MPRSRTSSRGRRSPPTTVLFDLDDTLFDHALTCRAALARVRRAVPALRRSKLDDLWKEYGRLLGVMHVEVMLGRTTSEESRAERFRALAAWAGQPIDRATADELAQSYRTHYQRLRRPVAGAPETVRRLRGRARVGVVTNHTVAEQTEKLAFLGLERDVDFLLTSEEVGAAKPDPAIFRAALARAGAEPHEAVMVGDSWSSDVAGAVGAGIRAVWFNRFHLDRPAPMPVEEFGSFRSRRRVDELLGFSAARSRVR